MRSIKLVKNLSKTCMRLKRGGHGWALQTVKGLETYFQFLFCLQLDALAGHTITSNRRVVSQFFLVSPDSHDRGLDLSFAPLPLGRLCLCMRRGEGEGAFCLSCTFIFRNERNWIKRIARISDKLVSQVAYR